MGTQRHITDTTRRAAANPREDAAPTEAMTATAGMREMAVVVAPMTPTAQATANWIVRAGRGVLAIIRVPVPGLMRHQTRDAPGAHPRHGESVLQIQTCETDRFSPWVRERAHTLPGL